MLSTGTVADRAGVNKQTLRYYERIGLIGPIPRDGSGYRAYPEETLERIRFIQRGKELGFQLAEIEELLNMRIERRTNCDGMRRRADAKRAEVRRKIRDLRRLDRALERLVESCATRKPTSPCPILESLDRGQAS